MKKFLYLIFLLVPVISFSQSAMDKEKIGAIDNKSNFNLRLRTSDARNQMNPSMFPIEDRVLNGSLINTNLLLNRYLISKMALNDSTKISRIQFSPFNSRVVLPGLGYYNNIGISSLWVPTDNLFLEGSTFINLQKSPNSCEILYGVRGELNYNLTELLQFKLWGQYISPSNNDPFKEISELYPKTSIGGTLIGEPAKNVKVGIGVEYQHNQINQKLESRSGGKIIVGF